MFTIKIIVFSLSVIYLLATIFLSFLYEKPLKILLFNSFLGLVLLSLLCIIKKYLALTLFFNIYSLSVSVIWGIPGVILMLVVNILFL